jgi:hypothetical protein
MASPVGGIDPKILQMILQQVGGDPSKLASLLSGAMPGMPPGGPPGAPPPPGGPSAMPPPPGMPGGNMVPGLTPPPPGGGMPPSQAPFGPDPGGPSLQGLPPPPQAPQAGARNPQMDAVNMTLGQAAYGGQERDLDRQQKLADELRGEAMPGMRGNSRVQTAANPLEFAATGLSRIGGQMKSDKIGLDQKAMFEERLRKLREDMGASQGLMGPE